MSQAAPAGGSPWIVGPAYDMTFFSTLWLPPLLVLGVGTFESFGVGAGFFVLWIYHLFIRLPHFGAMFRVTYLRDGQMPHYREHWVRYFAIPAFILVLYALPLTQPEGYATSFGFALTTAGYLWGYQHIGMQNYGILQVYRMRSGARGDDGGRHLERAIFYAIIVSVCAANHWRSVLTFVAGAAPGPSQETVGLWILGVAGVLSVVYLVRAARSGGLRTPAVLYFAVSAIAMVKWPFYDRLPAGSWFLVFNGHHSVAYLGLLFLMSWNEQRPDTPLRFRSAALAIVRFLLPLFAFALALILATASYHGAREEVGYGAPSTGSLEPLLGFFVAHYYVESLVWRFRHEHHRKTTLPLLRAPGVIAASAEGART